MKYNVLVIAGTTESRQVIEKLLGENPNERILASVATELGKEMLLEYDIDVHVGRLDQDGFLALLKENPCEKIIDASHPFAKIVSETVKKVAESADIPYERYERTNLQYDYEGIVHVKDVQEAITLLNELKGNVFLTTGVNTAAVEDNVRLIRETEAEVLVSKDSGKTGGVDVKVEACRQTGIKMILIDRPNAL